MKKSTASNKSTHDEYLKEQKASFSNEYTPTNFRPEVLENFDQSFYRDMFCDYTVVVEGKEFQCHRVLLNSCSGFFQSLFRSDKTETSSTRTTLEGMSADVFELVLKSIYTTCDGLNEDNILKMWQAAHKLQVQFLVEKCEDFVIETITTENVFDMFQIAQNLSPDKVVSGILIFMARNLRNFMNDDKFYFIEYRYLVQIFLMKESNATVDDKIDMILKWCLWPKIAMKRIKFLGYLIEKVNLDDACDKGLAKLLINKNILANAKALKAVNTQAAKRLLKNTGYNINTISFAR